MDECQFYDKKRLEELHRKEERLFVEAKNRGDIPNDLSNYEVPGLWIDVLTVQSVVQLVHDESSHGLNILYMEVPAAQTLAVTKVEQW